MAIERRSEPEEFRRPTQLGIPNCFLSGKRTGQLSVGTYSFMRSRLHSQHLTARWIATRLVPNPLLASSSTSSPDSQTPKLAIEACMKTMNSRLFMFQFLPVLRCHDRHLTARSRRVSYSCIGSRLGSGRRAGGKVSAASRKAISSGLCLTRS